MARRKDEFIIYYSGMATRQKDLFKVLDAGLEIGGMCFAYPDAAKIGSYVFRKISEDYGISILIDSGAFSILTSAVHLGMIKYYVKIGVSKIGTKPSMYATEIIKRNLYDIYYRRYVNWLKNIIDYVDFVVEVDLQMILGHDKIWKWRKEMVRIFDSDKVMFVWHGESDEYVAQMLTLSNNIGFSEFGSTLRNDQNSMYVMRLKNKYGDFWAHLFGFSAVRCQDYFGFEYVDSIDATLWQISSRYGELTVFENGRLIRIKIGRKRYNTHHDRMALEIIRGNEVMRKICRLYGIDVDKISSIREIPAHVLDWQNVLAEEQWRKWYTKKRKERYRPMMLW